MKTFETKTTEELQNMSEAEVLKYWQSKMAFDNDVLSSRVKALEEEKNAENYEELTKEVKQLKEEQVETLKAAALEQGRVIKAMKEERLNGHQITSIDAEIKSTWKSNFEAIKAHKIGRSKESVNMTIKAAADMTITGNVSGGDVPQARRLPGVGNIPERQPLTLDLLTTFNSNEPKIEWVYEANQDGTIDGTAEGAAKDQIDNDFVVASISFKKRAAYFKISTEMLDDVDFMSAWLRNKLLVRLTLDVDNEALNGTGAGQSLTGILSQATASSFGAPFALGVDNANEFDVLVAAMDQIEQAKQDINGLTIIMHPTDVNFLRTLKVSSTDKRYVNRVVDAAGMLSLDGVPIVKNLNMTQGDYLVGDFSKSILAQKSSIMLELGLDGNDFTKNMRTLLAEWRGEVIIETNDTTAFVTGDFATDKAALETA